MVTPCEGPPSQEGYSILPGLIPGLIEIYKSFYQEKLILVLEYSVCSCSYYSSRFELKFLRDKDLLLLMLIHGLSTRDGSLSTLAASLATAPPSPFSHFTSADQVTWLTASRYCDESWIKSAVEQLEVIHQSKIVTIPDSMVESIRQCSKIREKKDPPKKKEVSHSDILDCSVLKEVLTTISSFLQDKMTQVIDFSNVNSKYTPSYMEEMIWSKESAYWPCQGLLLILVWSLIKDDTALSCSTLELLSTMEKDMLAVEDMVGWLAYDFLFDLEKLSKAVSVLQILSDSGVINIPLSILHAFMSLHRISSLVIENDIAWSQTELPKEISALTSSNLQEQEEESPVHITSKVATTSTEIPPIEEQLPSHTSLEVAATVEITPAAGEKGFVLVLGDKVPTLIENRSSSLDVIEISDDEADDKDRMYPVLSAFHEKELVSKRILEQALEEQRKMLKEQENLVKGALDTLTKRLDSTGELLNSKALDKKKANQPQKFEVLPPSQSAPVRRSRAKGNGKCRVASGENADKDRKAASGGQELKASNKKSSESRTVSEARQGREKLSSVQQKKNRQHSLPTPLKQSSLKPKRTSRRTRRGSAPSVLEKSPSSENTVENAKKTSETKNVPEPKKNRRVKTKKKKD